MASSARVSALERLPLDVLDEISDQLANCDINMRSLQSFTLASKTCCFAARRQRFSQIRLLARDPLQLRNDLAQLTQVLVNPANGEVPRTSFVQRLKICELTVQEERGHVEAQRLPYDHKKRSNLDVHEFCQPKFDLPDIAQNVALEHPSHAETSSQLLSDFIAQLPGLRDLVWTCIAITPRCILSVLNVNRCRLHIHNFNLDSLRDKKGAKGFGLKSPDVFALATSPALYSIVAGLTPEDSQTSRKVTNEDAVLRMVSGLAPNLAHVYMRPETSEYAGSIRRRGPISEMLAADSLGSLQSLAIDVGTIDYEFGQNPFSSKVEQWGLRTDFTQLRSLALYWKYDDKNLDNKVMKDILGYLADIANDKLHRLHTLSLQLPQPGQEGLQDALIRLLRNLNPLETLDLRVNRNGSGLWYNVFDIILSRHGQTLRKLRLTYPVLRARETEDLVQHCPNLEDLEIVVWREPGEEIIYRQLSRLRRLRHVCLRLRFKAITRDTNEILVEDWLMEDNHLYPEYGVGHDDATYAFQGAAVDGNLVRGIYDLISPDRKLDCLELTPITYDKAEAYDSHFNNILEWLSRSWVFERGREGTFSLRELGRASRLSVRSDLDWSDDYSESWKIFTRQPEVFSYSDKWEAWTGRLL
ncbi:hypothetical protein F5Y04DRAFT_286796 [Hypomontagnella monticulosa]|nr:hypothetical protein F5Y04DRAFT_286796 [Hypomontagnella monticulosa]